MSEHGAPQSGNPAGPKGPEKNTSIPGPERVDCPDLYELENLRKVYPGPTEELCILNGANLRVKAGESIAVVGASGSGKSTLLHLLGALDSPSAGRILFRGSDLNRLSQEEKAVFRNRELGFVFQFHHLLPEFTTLENVAMPGIIGGMKRALALDKAAQALSLVGLSARMEHSVTTLSGGERQRAAIARAMLLKPGVLLADEPTGNLDEHTGNTVAELLMSLNRELRTTLIIVTHNPELAALMGRRLEIRAGEIYDRTV